MADKTFVLILLTSALVYGQIDDVPTDDDDFCVCVDVWKCENGYINDPTAANKPPEKFNAGEGLLDKRIQTCEGIQICCPVRNQNSNQTNPLPPPQPLPPAQVPALPTLAHLQGCGVKRFPGNSKSVDQNAFRISGGHPVSEETFYGEAPWMARIIVNGVFSCGGSLINQQAVLTGAHCVQGKRASDIAVEVGEWDTASTKEPIAPQKQTAINIVLHPDFNDKNLQNGLAIVFLPRPFTISETVDTICTPDSLREVDTTSCVAVGWGKEDLGQKYQLRPVLRKVSMPLMDKDKCVTRLRSTRLGQWFTLLPGFLCAGGVSDGDTCKGDGGGPLYCPMKTEPNRLAVVGVTAWGIDCGKGNPTVFVSVSDYITWISQQLNADP